jgi:hypothetical protein
MLNRFRSQALEAGQRSPNTRFTALKQLLTANVEWGDLEWRKGVSSLPVLPILRGSG